MGQIVGVTLRLDQTTKEHSLTLDSLFIIHNAVTYRFHLHDVVLDKQQPKKKFLPLTPSKVSFGKSCYYIATHTSDKMWSITHATFKVTVNGTRGTFGQFCTTHRPCTSRTFVSPFQGQWNWKNRWQIKRIRSKKNVSTCFASKSKTLENQLRFLSYWNPKVFAKMFFRLRFTSSILRWGLLPHLFNGAKCER